ncbi:N-acetylneuraminate synthase [candidate division WOR-1 bacterium RIFOXYA12_FULL_43_27]|uniref:N-acetylneuraminate synthase n=1 Tax=candidate division WOR-1 bacterium RIFOXYC2_FULL_46_14 TaxID=1802587 RepID=A0A1F4U3B0_UNCSA|nr:MAG: N-acetylneuraminate synthase [candidate division WOR-1 bacterium RIFOXYA12_FULL_43_27]OGC20238.1 MAG: N-acetylneuraminate synthase [candidate division WOR-1 bacterium RIFOXYB2_FULL_46_45]OGC32023.1 MAG: N-acetylneuraminate synthase [candidate division WOR-1 bacterium RIFOXYA2_FULL_46_56]OGC39426.1 MAG: N-acetylneuraminate synthase [candidate division WOR-1 bacterium RIFOXYC2_FULL_46_14]
MKRLKIGTKYIGASNPIFIIAEAGVNHNGSMKLARKMIDAAASSGASAVKFQTFIAEEVMTEHAPKARYQIKNTGNSRSQIEMAKGFELPLADFKKLKDYADKKGIVFLSTPFDSISAEYLNKIGVEAFKISSGDLTNLPLLRQIASFGKPIILSTGMAGIKEIRGAVNTIYSEKNKQLVLLHCTSNYPAEFSNINLRAMATIAKRFKIPAGYSDHSVGIEVSIAAAALGACVIEKHFTLDCGLPGPDHLASIEPNQLIEMVNSIRNVERALGSGVKVPVKSEIDTMKVARKSIVAAVNIPKGIKINHKMLTIKRPGNGLPPKYLNQIIGKLAKRGILKDSLLNKERDLV